MNTKNIIIVLLGFAILGIGYYYTRPNTQSSEEQTSIPQMQENQTGTATEQEDILQEDTFEFVEMDGDTTIETNTDETQDEPVGEIKTFEVSATDFEFSMDEIRVNQGDTVRIVLNNTGGFHDLVIDEFNARTEVISTGETTEVEFIASELGQFEYYCSVGDHRAMGMVGTLIVE